MTRALVLGGGGAVGIAWETGLVAGLAEHGIGLREADRIVGTSAGSVVGARLALGRDMVPPEPPTTKTRDESKPPARSEPRRPTRMMALLDAMAESQAHPGPDEARREIMGRFALQQETPPEEAFLKSFADLAGADWPAVFGCTSVNARTGEFVVWDATRGASLQRAVAASCCVPGFFPPISIDGERHIDGGMRTPLNTDVVIGTDIVLAVSVMPTAMLGAATRDELASMHRAGDHFEVVEGGGELVELAAGGMGLLDPSRGPEAFDLGRAQADEVADRVGTLWAS